MSALKSAFGWEYDVWGPKPAPKAPSPKLKRKARKACERRVQARIDALQWKPTRSARAELELLERGCIGCGLCALS
jgi:ferredoxin